MSGWIKQHRKIKEHWLYTEKRKFSKFEAWMDILLTVNYAPMKTVIKNKLIEVNRGESILSLDSWAKQWGWNKSSVIRFLEMLRKDGMIVIKNETITTRLTVCNYETYQDERNANETRLKRKRNANETETELIKEREEEQQEQEQEKQKRFVKPNRDDVRAYMIELNMSDLSQRFVDYYESNGWRVGRNAMKDWKAAVRTWKQQNNEKTKTTESFYKPLKFD